MQYEPRNSLVVRSVSRLSTCLLILIKIFKYILLDFSNFTFFIKFQFSPCCWFFFFGFLVLVCCCVVLVILGNEIAYVH